MRSRSLNVTRVAVILVILASARAAARRVARTGVAYVAHAGEAIGDTSVREAAREHGITLLETGIRPFLL